MESGARDGSIGVKCIYYARGALDHDPRALGSSIEGVPRESAKGGLVLGGYETQILAMRFPTGILYYR